jgi:predicted RNA binding protein YcfA (HicA-like mRNA interferase family)
MPKVFKVLSGGDVIKILITIGFSIKSQNGSHVKLLFIGLNKNTVAIVPNHKMLKQGTMISIYKQLLEIDGVNKEDLDMDFKHN